jgi:hypothetical protein
LISIKRIKQYLTFKHKWRLDKLRRVGFIKRLGAVQFAGKNKQDVRPGLVIISSLHELQKIINICMNTFFPARNGSTYEIIRKNISN